MNRLVATAIAVACIALGHTVATAGPPTLTSAVVVATFDSGTNPFHPCFRRAGLGHPRQRTPGYPAASRPLRLHLGETYDASLARSREAIDAIRPTTLYHLPGTNLSFYGGPQARTELVDTWPHGAQASSQIACGGKYGMAPDAQLLVLNWTNDRRDFERKLSWVARQPWIDVVHLNIQTLIPVRSPHVAELVAAGKLVVVAAGNGVDGQGANYPMEASAYTGGPGTLVAGANDNGGYASYSNLDPHVVMDGMNTTAAAPSSFDSELFSGTSSASPRVTGYVARVLADARARLGHTGRGLLTIPAGRPRPRSGPLSDGRLTAAELHEVVRRTADPNPHDSRYDGKPGSAFNAPSVTAPQPADLPFAFYPKMGYGEVSEHTADDAVRVLTGSQPMPDRAHEDRFYAVSEAVRGAPVPAECLSC